LVLDDIIWAAALMSESIPCCYFFLSILCSVRICPSELQCFLRFVMCV